MNARRRTLVSALPLELVMTHLAPEHSLDPLSWEMSTSALGALHLAGVTLNLFRVIGIIPLMGLATKNSTLLADYANQLRAESTDEPDPYRWVAEPDFLFRGFGLFGPVGHRKLGFQHPLGHGRPVVGSKW